MQKCHGGIGFHSGTAAAVSSAAALAEFENDSHAGRTAVCKKHTACHRMLGYVYEPLDSGIRTG